MSVLLFTRVGRRQLSQLRISSMASCNGLAQSKLTVFGSTEDQTDSHPFPRIAKTLRSAFPHTSIISTNYRTFITTSIDMATLPVQVPPLGESISDGTIAAILKQPGDSVEEDEPILQIETDKVTIDVRAPKAGILEALLVKEEDNVAVGHVVAAIADRETSPFPPSASSDIRAGSSMSTSNGAVSTPATAKTPTGPATPQSSHSIASSSDQKHKRLESSIRFPPRRTESGDIISMMPAAEAAAAALAASPKPQRISAPPKISQLFIKMPSRPSGPPLPPRKELSEWEIEKIMLGGAE